MYSKLTVCVFIVFFCFVSWESKAQLAGVDCTPIQICIGQDQYCSEDCVTCSGSYKAYSNTVVHTLTSPGPCSTANSQYVACYTTGACSSVLIPNSVCRTFASGQKRCDGGNPGGICGACQQTGGTVLVSVQDWVCSGCLPPNPTPTTP
jgi:hypothetical protein